MCDDLCHRCPLPEPGPPPAGLPASARSTPAAAGSRPAGALHAAQGQQLLAAQPLPQFQHGTITHLSHTHTHVILQHKKKLRLRCQKYTIYNYITVVLPTTVALSSLQSFKCLICCGNRRHPPLGSGPVSSPTWPPICVCFRKSKQHKNVASHEF